MRNSNMIILPLMSLRGYSFSPDKMNYFSIIYHHAYSEVFSKLIPSIIYEIKISFFLSFSRFLFLSLSHLCLSILPHVSPSSVTLSNLISFIIQHLMELNIHEHVNGTTTSTESANTGFLGDELKMGILQICLFSIFFVLGLIGNSLVLIGIGLNKGMQTPTNLLIFNLALADILFIIVCIPTTLFAFFGRWPFTDFGCKLGNYSKKIPLRKRERKLPTTNLILAQFINHLSAFMSIYLLVFMSVDRYLAVVHAVDSISNYRTAKNTNICIMYDLHSIRDQLIVLVVFRTLWTIGLSLSMFIGSLFTVIEFESSQPPAAMYCLLQYLRPSSEIINSTSMNTTDFAYANISQTFSTPNYTVDPSLISTGKGLSLKASAYWLGFVIFFYALPLSIIVILYGLMLKFLRGARGQSVGKSKRRATRMILAVVLTYALCWFLMQLSFISNVVLSSNTSHTFDTYMNVLTTFANVFAYLNSVGMNLFDSIRTSIFSLI